MKIANLLKTFGTASLASAMIAGAAEADFVSLQVVKTSALNSGIALDVYVLYARFNGATDTVLSVYNLALTEGSAGSNDAYGAFYHKDSSESNSGILQKGFGNWAPTNTGSAIANRPFDSYLTIGGLATATNSSSADPSWNSGGSGAHAGDASNWFRADLVNNGVIGWFNGSPPNNQGRVGLAGNTATDVRLGQFVIDSGTNGGEWRLTVAYNNGVAGSAVQFATSTFKLCPGFTYYRDLDGDGFGAQSSGSLFECSPPSGYVSNNLDCNDNDATLNPSTIWYRDLDGDGFGSSTNGTLAQCTQPTGYVRNNTDNCPSIANPGQEDCNGNAIGDVCELANGSVDCNSNGLVDSCEIAAGISPDCDSDGKPDDCEGAVFIASQSNLLPLTGAVFAEQTFTNLPRAYGVQPKITIEATADLGATNDGVIVTVDGGAGSVFFLTDGTDCPSTPNTAVLTYSLAAFNALVADGALTVRVTASGAVNSTTCPNGGVRIKLKYTGLPASSDCNNNGLLDSCEIGTGAVPDCNGNGFPDSCDIASGYSADCNGNGLVDTCEIAAGLTPDCDHDGRPDICEGAIAFASASALMPFSGTLPAEHTFTSLPRAYNGSAKITIEATADLGGATDGIIATLDGGSASTFFVADGTDCPSTPNTATITVPMAQFNALVADGSLAVRISGFGVVNSAGCANGGVRVKLDYLGLPASSDCNNNGLLDSCEIGTGAVPDCNGNGFPDSCDIASGSSADCNGNGKPDSCDIASGASSDINGNGRPDECSGEYVVGGTGYPTILSAAMQAPLGATILVAPGTRHERVAIQRRVTVRSVAGPAATILDGTGLTDSVVSFIDANATGAVFDGFTIRNGTSGSDWGVLSGGGMSIIGASPTVRNCVFEDNHSDFGGAIYMVQSASTIENCTFTNNSATTSGGALGFEVANGWTVRNCTFTGNTSLGGGGAAYGTSVAGTFVSCTMSANQAAASGGGIAWDSTLGGSILLDTCSLEANSALAGGGLAVVSGTGAFDLSRSRLCRNTPDNIVGAVHDLGGNTIGTDCNHNGICDADELAAGTAFDCNGNGVLDSCDIASATSLDCNTNGVPDSCDIATGHSHDIDANGIPDECSPDCDADGRPDAWEIAQGFETDCNANLQPDRCDIAQNPALDCNHNGAIDSCEGAANPALDCNHNGVIDSCEIAQVPALDCNHNGRLDTCDLADNAGLDCDHNGRIDSCDIAGNPGLDKNGNGHLDSCELARGDLNLDGVINAADLGILLNLWGLVNPPLGDLNRDGVVSAPDLGLLLNAWGSTP